MLQGATTPIRPKTELIAMSTWRAAGWNLIANPTGLLRRPFEGRILCSNERQWCAAQPHFVLLKDTEYTASAPWWCTTVFKTHISHWFSTLGHSNVIV